MFIAADVEVAGREASLVVVTRAATAATAAFDAAAAPLGLPFFLPLPPVIAVRGTRRCELLPPMTAQRFLGLYCLLF